MSFTRVYITIMSIILTCFVAHAEIHHHNPDLKVGGRKGLHGMVIFGSGVYFIEHIPMLSPPHDYQIVTGIIIKNRSGQVITPDLSSESFTLKPNSNFSLNDFITGRIQKFEGALYRGSFERDGQLISGMEKLTVETTQLHLARKLPSASHMKNFEVTDGRSVYQTAIITPQNNVQKVINKSLNRTLWCVVGPDFFEPCP